jgi:uncharacterized damage-inducible protein DinB
MKSTDLLLDAFERIRGVVHAAVDGLTPEQLTFRVDELANPIGWLAWHVSRIQDTHIAGVAGTDQVWNPDWAQRFGLPFDPGATGYGDGPEQVVAVRPSDAEVVTAYYDAVHHRSTTYVAGLTDDDLTRIVDPSWTPPVTLAVRLVSVISDSLQHGGQAAFIRGVVMRRT